MVGWVLWINLKFCDIATVTRRIILGVIFSPFLVSQAVKRETSPDTTG